MIKLHKRGAPSEKIKPCMPPLLEEETIQTFKKNNSTSYGGTACENIVKSYFLANQLNIAEPHVDDGVDILIEKEDTWIRGQVKKVVYQNKLDYKIKQRTGVKVYRSRFSFSFQGGGPLTSSKGGKRKQRGPESVDYFYHILLTPYRQLIWETPVNLIPLRKDGTFIQGKNPTIDRSGWVRKRADIDFNKLLIYAKYDPIIFRSYPDFFLEKKSITLDELFDHGK